MEAFVGSMLQVASLGIDRGEYTPSSERKSTKGWSYAKTSLLAAKHFLTLGFFFGLQKASNSLSQTIALSAICLQPARASHVLSPGGMFHLSEPTVLTNGSELYVGEYSAALGDRSLRVVWVEQNSTHSKVVSRLYNETSLSWAPEEILLVSSRAQSKVDSLTIAGFRQSYLAVWRRALLERKLNTETSSQLGGALITGNNSVKIFSHGLTDDTPSFKFSPKLALSKHGFTLCWLASQNATMIAERGFCRLLTEQAAPRTRVTQVLFIEDRVVGHLAVSTLFTGAASSNLLAYVRSLGTDGRHNVELMQLGQESMRGIRFDAPFFHGVRQTMPTVATLGTRILLGWTDLEPFPSIEVLVLDAQLNQKIPPYRLLEFRQNEVNQEPSSWGSPYGALISWRKLEGAVSSPNLSSRSSMIYSKLFCNLSSLHDSPAFLTFPEHRSNQSHPAVYFSGGSFVVFTNSWNNLSNAHLISRRLTFARRAPPCPTYQVPAMPTSSPTPSPVQISQGISSNTPQTSEEDFWELSSSDIIGYSIGALGLLGLTVSAWATNDSRKALNLGKAALAKLNNDKTADCTSALVALRRHVFHEGFKGKISWFGEIYYFIKDHGSEDSNHAKELKFVLAHILFDSESFNDLNGSLELFKELAATNYKVPECLHFIIAISHDK